MRWDNDGAGYWGVVMPILLLAYNMVNENYNSAPAAAALVSLLFAVVSLSLTIFLSLSLFLSF